MDLTGLISLTRQKPALDFVVIGGWAVAAHGHTRSTFDFDFLTSRQWRGAWTERMQDGGLKCYHESRNFTKFTNEPDGDLDVMFVAPESFDKIWQESSVHSFPGADAHLVSLNHLIALKLHVLKQGLEHRTSKDADDVEFLIRRNGIDLNDREYEQLFLKYGNREIYETIKRIVRGPE